MMSQSEGNLRRAFTWLLGTNLGVTQHPFAVATKARFALRLSHASSFEKASSRHRHHASHASHDSHRDLMPILSTNPQPIEPRALVWIVRRTYPMLSAQLFTNPIPSFI